MQPVVNKGARHFLAALVILTFSVQVAAQEPSADTPATVEGESRQQEPGDPPNGENGDARPNGVATPRAYIDGTGPEWRTLGEADFADVNGRPETWEWDGELVRTTGQPTGVYRTRQVFRNFEMMLEWRHLESGGNSGVFVWVPWQALADLPPDELPGYGIEVQMLDHGFADAYRERTGEEGDWFTTNGDVFGVGETTFSPFPPTSPNGARSFPRKHLSGGVGEWNHYYVRAVNGELRLWVNGEEVSGGNGADPNLGYFCLEAEGAPVEFRNIRIRQLP